MSIFLLSIVGFAQEQTKDTIIPQTTAERLIDKYSEKGINAFNTAVDKITPTAIEGFEVVVRLQIAKGIVNILPLFGFIIFFILFYKEYFRIDKLGSSYGPFDEGNITPLLIINFVASIILFIATLICIQYAIQYLLAPEWFAIKEIMGIFK